MEKNFHPAILALPTTELDLTYSQEDRKKYSGYSNWFYVVPTEMVITGSRDFWKGCPPMVNWDMLQCIREIKAKGEFPYNREVGSLFCQKFNPSAQYDDGTFLSSVVYCTQKYESELVAEAKAKDLHFDLLNKGFIQATEDILKDAANTKKKFHLVVNYTDFLGNESKGIAEEKYTLKDWGAQGMYWMRPRARRTGYRAKIGQ